jgi:hypothetical protein
MYTVTTAGEGAPACGPDDGAACPHRRYHPGGAAYGLDVPAFAMGAPYPGDEPGYRCAQGGDICTPYPPDCPRWKPTGLTCPACLAFKERRYPQSLFLEAKLLEANGAYYCPECFEVFASLTAVAENAVEALRDALDDCDYAEGVAAYLAEEKDAGNAPVQ